MADHSFMCCGGVWPVAGRPTIGVFEIKQWPTGAALDLVAAEAANKAKELHAKIMVDLSNNTAFASLLAGHFSNPADTICGASITNALEHASIPTRLQLAVSGVQSVIPKWSASKRQLVEELGCELDSGSMRLAKVGDWEALRDELSGLERTIRASGSVAYGSASGKHDDGPMSLALLVFALRRLGGMQRRRARSRHEAPSARAWT